VCSTALGCSHILGEDVGRFILQARTKQDAISEWTVQHRRLTEHIVFSTLVVSQFENQSIFLSIGIWDHTNVEGVVQVVECSGRREEDMEWKYEEAG
jgi:hypothetical protein